MAEEEKEQSASLKSSLTSSPGKGLNTDTSPEAQPERSYRFALNAMNESQEGDQGFLINEQGNYECGSLNTSDWLVIGHVYTTEDTAIVFLAPRGAGDIGMGKIVEITDSCKSTTIMTSDCLNFSAEYPVQAVYRIRRGCERHIYFTDNNNTVRVLNLDSLRDYLKEGLEDFIIDNPDSYQESPSIWDCEKMGMFPNMTIPDIFIESIIDGGGTLKVGAYQFAVAYQDEDLNSTNFFDISNPIPITRDPIGSPLNEADAFDIQGSEPGETTEKTINLRFNNVDTSFTFLRLVCLPSTSGTGNIDGDVWEIANIPISSETVEFAFSGWDETATPKLGLDEILIPSLVFEKAKTLEQIDNRLVLGNIGNSITNWAKFQQAANDIAIKYYTTPLYAYSTHHGGPTSYRYYSDYRTFMRDEVYALGIVWIFRNGQESPVFHIPGRKANRDPFGTPYAFNGIPGADPNNPESVDHSPAARAHYNGMIRAEHNRRPIENGFSNSDPDKGGWDTDPVATSLGDTSVSDGDEGRPNTMSRDCNTEHLVGYTSAQEGNVDRTQRWNVWNTAIRDKYYWLDEDGNRSTRSEDSTTLITEGHMGYYECRDKAYPDKKDCSGARVFPDGNIRHHRMPDTTLEPHYYGDPYRRVRDNSSTAQYCTNTNPYCINDTWVDPSTKYFLSGVNDHGAGWGMGDGAGPAEPANEDSYLLERIISLGIKALNVNIPAGFEDRIQGFKIVRGIRTDQDRSVLDKGITMYNTYGSLSGRCQPETGVDNAGNFVNGWQPAVSSASNWEQCGGLTKGFRHGENDERIGNKNDWRECVDNATTTLLRPYGNYPENCNSNVANNRCMPWWFENDCGPDHSCTDGTGTRGGCKWTENKPFVGYPHPNLPCSRVTTSGLWDRWTDSFSGGLFNIAYHGPLGKFSTSNINAEYVKYERILVGRVNVTRHNSHKSCDDCGNRPASWTYQYCDFSMSFIPTHDQGRLFRGGAYGGGDDQGGGYDSYVGTEYHDKPLVNRRIVAQAYAAAKGGSVKATFSSDDFKNGYFQQECYVYEIMNSIYDYDHYQDMDGAGDRNGMMKVGVPYPYHRPYNNSCSRNQDVAVNRFMQPPADNSCYQLDDSDSGMDHSKGYSGKGKTQASAYYVSLKQNAPNAFGNLSNIDYVQTSNKINRLGKDYPGVGLVDDPTDNGFIMFGGDAFISKFAFRKTNHNVLCYNCDGGINPFGGGEWSRFGGMFHNSIVHYYVESYINCEYRHSQCTASPGTSTSLSGLSTDDYDSHYPYCTLGNINDGFGLHGGGFLDSEDKYGISDGTKSTEKIPSNKIHINKYNLNYDFIKSNTEKRYRGLPMTYDYCSGCYENYPTRIVYSQQSFKEEISDNYRVFFAENYSDIPGHTGDITNLFTIGNTIYAHCSESLWRLFKSRQEVKTDNVSLRIGTGAFLAEPPQQMTEAEFGYLGSQSQWATIVTENGTFFVDSRQGRVYLLQGDKPVDLSNVSMRNFFENNLTLEINEQYERLTGDKFPLGDHPHHPEGSGFIAAYDSRHTRYILTKRSYVCLDEDALLNGYRKVEGTRDFDPDKPYLWLKQYGTSDSGWKRWVYKANKTASMQFVNNNPAFFRDTSYTVSFNFSLGAWASFHSYKPNAYVIFKNSFFSKENSWNVDNSDTLYKHGVSPEGNNYTCFYSSTPSPFAVDFIVTQNGLTTFEYNNIHWITHASVYNSTTRTYTDQRYFTFDHVLFYNSYQSSGLINLINKDGVPTALTTISNFDSLHVGQTTIARKERTFSMNALRDAVIDRTQPLFTKDWNDNNYQFAHNQGYLDAINSNAVGVKPWFQAERFRDKYLGIRLIFSNFVGTDNCKLIFNYLYTQQTFTAR